MSKFDITLHFDSITLQFVSFICSCTIQIIIGCNSYENESITCGISFLIKITEKIELGLIVSKNQEIMCANTIAYKLLKAKTGDLKNLNECFQNEKDSSSLTSLSPEPTKSQKVKKSISPESSEFLQVLRASRKKGQLLSIILNMTHSISSHNKFRRTFFYNFRQQITC